MEYSISGSSVSVDVIPRSCSPADETSPIESASEAGPRLDEIVQIDEDGGEPLVLAGSYRLLRRIGRGGMGAVYLAEQLHGGPRVAVKVLDARHSDWSLALEHFIREARLTARIHHPNVVEILDFGSTAQGVVYLVMELLEGRDLREIGTGGRLCWRWARYIMRQVCAGVGAIHRAGVVHRDLKPSNCFFLQRNATVKVLDFGIATGERPRRGACLGREQAIIGTPEYMAPEQIRGEPVNRRADVYAAGALTFKLLTGRPPFIADTAEEVFDQQLHRAPPTIASVAPELVIPERLDELLRFALAKDPRSRFASMSRFAAALSSLPDPPPQRVLGPRELASPRPASEARLIFEEAPTNRRIREAS